MLLILLGLFVAIVSAIGLAVLLRPRLIESVVLPLVMPLVRFLEERGWFYSCPEGFAVNIVKGGSHIKSEIRWRNYTLSKETWDVIPDGTDVNGRVWKEPYHPFGGYVWVGPPWVYQVYQYKLRWHSPRVDGEVVAHDEQLIPVMLKEHIFYICTKNVEDINQVPVTYGFLITLKCTNPYRFVFKVQDPFEILANLIAANFTGYAGARDYRDINKEREIAEDAFWQILQKTEVVKNIEEKCALEITIKPKIKDVDLPQGYQEAAAKKWQAEQEAETVRVRAKAEEDRMKCLYRVVEEFGDTGKLIRVLEAVERSPSGIFTVHAVPGLLPLIQSGIGKSLEVASQQEIREEAANLKKELQKVGKRPTKKASPKKKGK